MTAWTAMNVTSQTGGTGAAILGNVYSAFDLTTVGYPILGMLLWVVFLASLALLPKMWRRILIGVGASIGIAIVMGVSYYILYPLFDITGHVAYEMTWMNWVELAAFGVFSYLLGTFIDNMSQRRTRRRRADKLSEAP